MSARARHAAARSRSACSGSRPRTKASASAQDAQVGTQEIGPARNGRGRRFYMVGGSWRALARIDMFVTDFRFRSPISNEIRARVSSGS